MTAARFTGPAVSREQPWPGLMPFTEEAHAFFHGRDEEVEELLRLIRRGALTVLFGLSGLGKSSLLNAGLFPRLRREEFLPVYIRLDVLSDTPFAEQVMARIAANASAHGVEAPRPREGETLWEYFHRRDADFWSAKNRLLTPVLVFDQFEELFTLGRHAPGIARRCREFLEALGDLVEGRTPAEVIAMLERDPARGEALDFARATYKVLLSFREDYLPDFEGLRGVMPSIMRGRLRLARMNGSQARAAILESGGHLVSEAVCDRIIRFVASSRGGVAADAELERLEVEPALLSVVCRELNNKRIAGGLTHISADLLEGEAQQEIIREFYEESVADLDPRLAEFIEDQLLTEAGYRDSYALEDALRLPGVTREGIDTLIARRVVRLDERAGVLRVELTHDVLTRVAKESRDRRKEREEKRLAQLAETAHRRRVRGWVALGSVVLAGSVGLAATFALLLERSNEEKRRLVETQSNVLLDQAIGQLERNVPSEPQAVLAEAMRLNPDNSAAVARSVTYLSRRTFAREIAERKLASPDRGVDLRARAAFVSGKSPGFTVIDLDSGAVVGTERALARAPVAMAIAGNRSRIAWDEGEGGVAFASLPSGDKVLLPLAGAAVRDLLFSHDGRLLLVRLAGDVRLFEIEPQVRPVEIPAAHREVALRDGPCAMSSGGEWLACGDRRTVSAWNRLDGQLVVLPHPSPLNTLEFSGDGRHLVTGSQDKNARVWEVRAARLVGAPLLHEGAVLSAAFSADGDQLVTGSLDRTARIWALRTGTPLIEPLVGSTPVIQARVQPDGRSAATLDAGGRFALWELVPAEPPAALAGPGERVRLIEASPDGRVLATVSDTALRVFDAATSLAPSQMWSRDSQAADAPLQLRLDAGSRWLAVALPDGSVELRDAKGALARTLRQPGRARLMEFSADASLLAIVSEDGAVRIWHTASGQLQGLPLQSSSRLSRLQFSPDGKALLTVEAAGVVRLWDVGSTLSIAAIEPTIAQGRVAFAGFTGRDRELVVVEEKLARLFEVVQEKNGAYRVSRLSQLSFLNTVWSADLNAARRRLVVGGVDGTARMVDLEPLRLAGSAMKHDGVVVSAGFSPDGRWVVTRTEQSTRIWHARTGYPVADAVRHDNRVVFASLLGNGAHLVSVEENAAPQVTRINLDFSHPHPAWLPALVEVAGRGRFDKTGTVAPIDNPRAEIAALRAAVGKESPSAWWKDWGGQVLARLGSAASQGDKP